MTELSERMEDVIRIDRVVAIFEVWPRTDFPITKFKVKVLQRADAKFLGVPNAAIKNAVTGNPEWTSGMGDSIEEALKDAIRYFFLEVRQNRSDDSLTENDFSWASPEDF
ncbi:MAG: hypothetical protein GXX96_06185 [Planctomycetaceae bacterium]|jgi:hypothetical protein|nr:hypothetical protein [Planctomycetaceae bacterium]